MCLRARVLMGTLNDTPPKPCRYLQHVMVLLVATAVKWVLEEKAQAPQTLAGTAVCYLPAFSVISLKSAKYLPISFNITPMRIKV